MEESSLESSFSVQNLIDVIEDLPSNPYVEDPCWYTTQKQHWLGWLSHYHGPGAYGRKPGLPKRAARFASNHIVCAPMLLWLIKRQVWTASWWRRPIAPRRSTRF